MLIQSSVIAYARGRLTQFDNYNYQQLFFYSISKYIK